MKIWQPNGRLAWTNLDRERIGHNFKLEGPLETAIDDNRATSSFVSTSNSSEEDDFEAGLGYPSLLQVYAPIPGSKPGEVIGAYEIYANPASVTALIGSRRRMIWLTVAAVFAALWGARSRCSCAAARARLVESNRLLEESALEAVASLNETVDAKDPYTAGHSLRVQRIAVESARRWASTGTSSRRCVSPACFMTSGRSECPTRSSRSRRR